MRIHILTLGFKGLTLLYDILTCHCLKIEIEFRVGTKNAENELFNFLISRLSGPKMQFEFIASTKSFAITFDTKLEFVIHK